MKDEELFALANDARLINATEGVLFPLLIKGREDAISTMCAKFRGGEKDLLTDVARITTLDDLIRQLKAKQQKGNKAADALTRGK